MSGDNVSGSEINCSQGVLADAIRDEIALQFSDLSESGPLPTETTVCLLISGVIDRVTRHSSALSRDK